MQATWRSMRWISGKLLSLALLLLAALGLSLMYALLAAPRAASQPPRISVAQWLKAIWAQLVQWMHGQFIPQSDKREVVRFWTETMRSLRPELLVSLKLMGTALAIGVLLGLLFGWLISRLGPARVRKPVFGLTLFLAALPDLLVATFFDIGLALMGRFWGFRSYGPKMQIYTQYLGPSLALAVLLIPYIARLTAGALEEVSGELYVRTAMAKGLPRGQVLLKHIGKHVLVRLWTVLPVIMSILISGSVIVEYMSEVRGIGRGLMLVLAPIAARDYRDPYGAFFKMLPLLLLFTVAVILSEWGLRRLDPRIGQPVASGEGHSPSLVGGPQWRLRDGLRSAAALPGGLWNGIRNGLAGVPFWFAALPGRLLAALRALKDPALLTGTLLVAGLVAVAIFAPQIANHDPNHGAMAYQDPSGKIWAPPFGPEPAHLFGTDAMGRDIFSRVVFGTRYALLFAALATPARFLLALVLGLLAAWRGGIWERLIRLLTIFFTALPVILLPLVAIRVFNYAYPAVAASVAWGVFWVAFPGVARLAGSIRNLARTVMSAAYLEGGVAAGAGTWRLLTRYVLPQMWPQLVTMAALEVPQVLTMTATLSYFRTVPGGWIMDQEMRGVPRIPEWGSMMDEPLMILLKGQWWLWAPFAALFVAVLAFNLVGEGLRRRLRSNEGWQL